MPVVAVIAFGVFGLVLLVGSCLTVLRPFFASITWAAILTFATWPIYRFLLRVLKGRHTLAALLMTLFIATLVVVPVTLLTLSLADDVRSVLGKTHDILKNGLPDPPAWVEKIPVLGANAKTYWQGLAHDSAKLAEVLKDSFERWKEWFVARGLDVGQGAVHLVLSVFVAFFFYRDGARMVQGIRAILTRFVGDRGHQLFDVTAGTIKGVVYGIVGTALAQGILAGIGFLIAGIPAPLPVLLAVGTFFLSLIPVGPPLVWFPVTIWLFSRGSIGWGIFMALYGFFIISGVDNLLKPYLISKGSNLPFILVFFGVLGGVMAFGFIGIFVGPTLLAVGYTLIQPWCFDVLEDREE